MMFAAFIAPFAQVSMTSRDSSMHAS